MPEAFFSLSRDDQREALLVAASRSGRAVHLLEKDIWVVWILDALFRSGFAGDLVFKGGTSLSKAYSAIARFSEDIDLTYDIRAIAPDLVGVPPNVIPRSRSQQQRWTDIIRERLPEWLGTTVVPMLDQKIRVEHLDATLQADGDRVFVRYNPLTEGTRYVSPAVLLDFGARSTGEPHETRDISCDAAAHLPEIVFPVAAPRVMRAERTFWEKATAIHVFCRGGRFRGPERFSRHWYDVTALDRNGYAALASNDRTLAHAVAEHKSMFFRETDGTGQVIDYIRAISGELRLVPDGDAAAALEADYRKMIEDGLLFDEAPTFQALLDACRILQDRMNATGGT